MKNIHPKITKPTFIIKKERLQKNVKDMLLKTQKTCTELHPHFKTHQSQEVGTLLRNEGVNKITVSSFSMAEKFINQSFDEITVAFPVNRLEIDRINYIAERTNLNITVVSNSAVIFLDKNLKHSVGIIIKIDSGYNRTGIDPDNKTLIETILKTIEKSSKLTAHSFMTHTGHNYQANNLADILSNNKTTIKILADLKSAYNLKTSLGDTPGCTLAYDFGNTDILRPGNFVYYDYMQYNKGICSLKDIAVSVKCPVVAKHPQRKEVIIYGGAVHFSKEYLVMPDGSKNYGQVVIYKGKKIVPAEGTYIKALSQEHGILNCTETFFNNISERDLVEIIPIHSCLTANLMLQDSVIV